MEAKVIWKSGMAFEGLADSSLESGLSLALDAKAEAGGQNLGFRPMELLAIGLAGCTGMDVISILQKKKQAVSTFEVRVHAQRTTEHPQVFSQIQIEYVIGGQNIDRAAVERAIELSETKYCPAQAMFSKATTIEHTYTIVPV